MSVNSAPNLLNPDGTLSSTKECPSPKTILLVEDEELLLDLTAQVLRKGGFLVVEAQDPETALRLVEGERRIQLLVSDINLPKTSGLQLFEVLKKACPNLKAVFISGYTSEQVQDSNLLPNDAVFLQKPYQNSALVEAIRELLG